MNEIKVNDGLTTTMNEQVSTKVKTRRSVWVADDVKKRGKILAFYKTG